MNNSSQNVQIHNFHFSHFENNDRAATFKTRCSTGMAIPEEPHRNHLYLQFLCLHKGPLKNQCSTPKRLPHVIYTDVPLKSTQGTE